MSSLHSISFSLMVILTKGHGLKEILNYLLIILWLLQNVREIILITKLLILLRIYGKIIISWEAQIGFLSLVPDHIVMSLLICGLLIILIQGVFSSRGKLQRLSQFYIVDFVTSMLFTMSMNVILHKALLILLMVIHPMLPLLINEYIPEVTTITRLMLLYLFGLHKSQNISLSLTNMLLKIWNCFMMLRILQKILILLFVWPAQWPMLQYLLLLEACFPPI